MERNANIFSVLEKIEGELSNFSTTEVIQILLAALENRNGTLAPAVYRDIHLGSLEIARAKGVTYAVSRASGLWFGVVKYKNFSTSTALLPDRTRVMQHIENLCSLYVRDLITFTARGDELDLALDEQLIMLWAENAGSQDIQNIIADLSRHDDVLKENRMERKTDPEFDKLSKIVTSGGPVLDNTIVKFQEVGLVTAVSEITDILAIGFLPQNPASVYFESLKNVKNEPITVHYYDKLNGYDIDKASCRSQLIKKHGGTKFLLVSDAKIPNADNTGVGPDSVYLIPNLIKIADSSLFETSIICNAWPHNQEMHDLYKEVLENKTVAKVLKRRLHNQEMLMVLERGNHNGYEDFILKLGIHVSKALKAEEVRMLYFRNKQIPGKRFFAHLWEHPDYEFGLSQAEILQPEIEVGLPTPIVQDSTLMKFRELMSRTAALTDIGLLCQHFGIETIDIHRCFTKNNRPSVKVATIIDETGTSMPDVITRLCDICKREANCTKETVCISLALSKGNFVYDKERDTLAIRKKN